MSLIPSKKLKAAIAGTTLFSTPIQAHVIQEAADDVTTTAKSVGGSNFLQSTAPTRKQLRNFGVGDAIWIREGDIERPRPDDRRIRGVVGENHEWLAWVYEIEFGRYQLDVFDNSEWSYEKVCEIYRKRVDNKDIKKGTYRSLRYATSNTVVVRPFGEP